jgi:hypothetical protein
MRYRIAPTIWSLVTAHDDDETERCMFVGDGVRCERRTEYLISSIAELACTSTSSGRWGQADKGAG